MACGVVIVLCCVGLSVVRFPAVHAQREGQPCTVEDGPGVCKLIKDCAYAERLVSEEMIKPTHCSYSGKWEVVCCPAEEIPDYALGRFGGFFSDTHDGKLVSDTLTCHHDGNQPIKCCRIVPDKPPEPEPQSCPPVIKPARKTNQLVWDKCVDYQRFVTPCVAGGAGGGGARAQYRRLDTCAQDGLGDRIAFGEPAKPREFPHMALLGYRIRSQTAWVAGGTLISDRFILTAGHIVTNIKWGDVQYARLGTLSRDPSSGLLFNVERRITYDGYNRTLKYHDIALLKLDRRVPLSPDIRPACLPLSTTKSNTLLVTGWGLTSNSGPLSDVLRKTIISEFDTSFCRNSIDRQSLPLGWINEQMMCAGGTPDQRNDSCEGDSGGPMQTYLDEIHCMYAVVGVVSWGAECGRGEPGVYTRVLHYVDWIVNTIW